MILANILVLIIDQNTAIAEFLHQLLRFEGLSTLRVSSENEALALFGHHFPDLILLGSLPGKGSVRIVRNIRIDPKFSHVPLIMVSTAPSDDAIAYGLDAGADDYLSFPCSRLHLAARVHALLRRTGSRPHERVLRLANLEIFSDSHRVCVDGIAIEILPCCYDLLHLFMEHPGQTFSREEIGDLLSHKEEASDIRIVDVKIVRLRRALGSAKNLIKTMRGQGYMLSSA